MGQPVDASRLRAFLDAFGRRCTSSGRVYLVDGATSVLRGFRASTASVDLVMDPEPCGAFEAIAKLRKELDLDVELSSPAHYVPELPDWREHSPFVGRFGEVDVFEYDLRAQALAKLARGSEPDRKDAHAMLASGAITVSAIREAFGSIRARLSRYPRVDIDELERRILALDPGTSEHDD